MRAQGERRRPDRPLVVLRLLRRITVAALVLSALLWVVPFVLTEMGVLGPSPEEWVQSADRAITLARGYGAGSLPDFQKAEHERDRARDLARAGQRRETGRAAERAVALATEAQKQALVHRAQRQQEAEAVYNDLDRQINDLEKLYASVTPGLEKEQIGQLLRLMKVTRQSAGVVFLAYEKEDWEAVLRAQVRARDTISGTRRTLESARRP
ncbi:MAG TPA: hypothetical protein VMR21_12020 [Vicinamibacteria bacterium]|nr:hypothetical protein [Vicinamibacteria bacterium]